MRVSIETLNAQLSTSSFYGGFGVNFSKGICHQAAYVDIAPVRRISDVIQDAGKAGNCRFGVFLVTHQNTQRVIHVIPIHLWQGFSPNSEVER